MARVCAVASSKGGVGKTTTTANLAATLAADGYDVAVVDGDIGMANLGAQLGVDAPSATLHDVLASGASVADACYEGPHGMTVVPGGAELEAFSEADITRLGRVVGSFADRDFVFVDTGAGLSHETALPLGLSDEVLLVSTADRDALGDTEKTRKLAERLGADVAGAVLTRVTPGDAPNDAAPLSAPVLGSVPEDASLHEASDGAVPVTDYDADAPAAAAYRSIAGSLTEGPVRAPDEEAATFAPDTNETVTESMPGDGPAGSIDAAAGGGPEQSTRALRTQNRRADASRDTPQGQEAATADAETAANADAAAGAEAGAEADAENTPAGSWEDSPAWSEQPAEELQQAGGEIPSAEGGVTIDDDEAVAFEESPQAAPLAEEAETDGGEEQKGFLGRLFS